MYIHEGVEESGIWFRVCIAAQQVKNLPAKQETWVQSQGWEDPMEKGKPGEFHRLYNPRGRKELHTTEQLSLHFMSNLETLIEV